MNAINDLRLLSKNISVLKPCYNKSNQNKCINCTLALFRQSRTAWHGGRDVTIEDLAAMLLDQSRCHVVGSHRQVLSYF